MESESSSFEPWNQLDDKIVLVTGSSSGLGVEFCSELAKAGCRLIAAARRVEKLKELCDSINTEYPSSRPDRIRAVALELDVTASEPVLEAQVQKAWDIFGKIDVLINNAGVRERIHGPLDLTKEEWDKVIATNQTGSYLMSKIVGKHMRNSKQGGSIINISSLTGLNRVQFYGGHAYAASKTALNAITKVTALEFGPYNIRVNTIAPGIFPSQITQGLLDKPKMANILGKVVVLPNYEGNPYPGLTSMARYLIHDSSKYVTGNVFIVDSGATLPGLPLRSSL